MRELMGGGVMSMSTSIHGDKFFIKSGILPSGTHTFVISYSAGDFTAFVRPPGLEDFKTAMLKALEIFPDPKSQCITFKFEEEFHAAAEEWYRETYGGGVPK